jgi:hypothetical protein
MWNPLKRLGRKLNFMTVKRVLLIFIPLYLLGLFCLYNSQFISETIRSYLPLTFSLIGLVLVLKSFSERKNAQLSWLLIIMNHFWVALAISFNEQFNFNHVYLYLSGPVITGLLGFLCLERLRYYEKDLSLNQFYGHSFKYRKLDLVFLFCCLGLAGFPVTPTFVGEDLIFSHIHEDQPGLAFFTALSFIIDGLAIIRIYARVFLGPHSKSKYEMAYRSS